MRLSTSGAITSLDSDPAKEGAVGVGAGVGEPTEGRVVEILDALGRTSVGDCSCDMLLRIYRSKMNRVIWKMIIIENVVHGFIFLRVKCDETHASLSKLYLRGCPSGKGGSATTTIVSFPFK